MTDDLPAITLPAELVIPAWRNAYLATGQDDEHGDLARIRSALRWIAIGLALQLAGTLVAIYALAARP